MIKFFVSPALVEVEMLKEMLEHDGIPCTVKNQRGSSLAGEVPFAEVFPELWILNDNDLPRAQEFLKNWREAQPADVTAWTCSRCGEVHAKDFTACWECGHDRQNAT
ncbi:MAG: DUF2007 domain-containing protein [Nitrospirales bacterium]|nr:DUF2007 domain-containing protein [Nitrospirales bacterium]